jgi:hypothetical protein
MKTFTLLSALILSVYGGFSQNKLTMENNTLCSFYVHLHAIYPNSSCSTVTNHYYVLSPGTMVTVTSPSVSEWAYAEILAWPYNSFSFAVGIAPAVDPGCVSCHIWDVPSSATVTTGSDDCSVVSVDWQEDCDTHKSYLIFN